MHKHIVIGLITCVLSASGDFGAKKDQLQNRHGPGESTSARETLLPRQTPIIVAPPSGFRTSQDAQPTGLTSLNYWWPYGPNGVNPTATATPVSLSDPTEMEETDIVDDASTDIKSSTPLTTPPLTNLRTLVSTTSVSTMTETKETSSDKPSRETKIAEPITSRNGSFKLVTLVPLFIILGILVAATLVGWAYGQCVRRRACGEPAPGGPDIGGKPYDASSYGHDTTGPLHSLGVSWVDASRIHSQYDVSSDTYHTLRGSPMDEEPGTPSKTKRETRNWFRHTLSGRKWDINSPSGEKGLNVPLTYATHDRQPPINVYGARNFDSGPYRSQSPKTLRIVNTPLAPGPVLLSPASTQPTPFLSASRHASVRRKIANKVKEEKDILATTSKEVPWRLDHEERGGAPVDAAGWTMFQDDSPTRSPPRRYPSSRGDSKSPAWSPDPGLHRERMRRLRSVAESARCTSPVLGSLSKPGDAFHPLPPTPAVLLSPPLQPHLFFTRANSDDSGCDDISEYSVSKLDFTRADPSQKLSRRPHEPGFDHDSFGPRVALSPANRHARKGKGRAPRYMESTETLPLSPELRGAAMTKLDELVKSHWSSLNLADLPQSPTLYGALCSPSSPYSKWEDGPHQAQGGIEEALLSSPGVAPR